MSKVKGNHGLYLSVAARGAAICFPLMVMTSCMSSAMSGIKVSQPSTIEETTALSSSDVANDDVAMEITKSEAQPASETNTEATGETTPTEAQSLEIAQTDDAKPADMTALAMEPTAVNAGLQSIYAATAMEAAKTVEEPQKKFTFASLFAPRAKAPKPAKPKQTARVISPVLVAPPAANDSESDDDEPAGLAKLVSAPGMARMSANGLWIQTARVDTHCFKPDLIQLIRKIEKHFGKPAVVTSGYRDVKHNRRAGGSSFSRHTTCDAADIQVKDVSKWELAEYARSLPERGGVGTYCYTKSVHIDTGFVRDWNWRCRRKKR